MNRIPDQTCKFNYMVEIWEDYKYLKNQLHAFVRLTAHLYTKQITSM